jgi:hypothetical protein
MNLETRSAYAVLFERLFQMLGNTARSPIRFHHIHGGNESIHTITVDMCQKQAPGKLKIF